MNLNNRHILITGASSGIGEATARHLVHLGATLTLVARRKDNLQAICTDLNKVSSENCFIQADLSQDADIEKIAKKSRPLDGLVHCAGIVFPLPVKFIRRKHLNQVWNINTFAPILLTSALLSAKKINSGSSIVFLSSISTTHPYPGGSIYVSSKAALEAFSKNLALELAGKKIRSNVISPALVKTQILEDTIQASDAQKLKEYEAIYPFGFGETEDVAKAIAYFLSSDSKWVTGQNLAMEGGSTLNLK